MVDTVYMVSLSYWLGRNQCEIVYGELVSNMCIPQCLGVVVTKSKVRHVLPYCFCGFPIMCFMCTSGFNYFWVDECVKVAADNDWGAWEVCEMCEGGTEDRGIVCIWSIYIHIYIWTKYMWTSVYIYIMMYLPPGSVIEVLCVNEIFLFIKIATLHGLVL